MNSPSKINYETRPVKFTERKMLLGTFQRLCNFYKEGYQYIGFGGLTFTDFKLFHKELHIKDMHSIEGGNFNVEKIKFNSPYSFINIISEHSSTALNNIDLSKKSLVWLDYDGALDNYMFEDLSILINNLPVGSIYVVTCNRELKGTSGEIYDVEEFKEKFGDIVPFDIEKKDFSGTNNYITIRKMLMNVIKSSISDRKRNGENVHFKQLYNIIYEENRGARMFTFGGVITETEQQFDELNLCDFDFTRIDHNTYKIDIPNLTQKEAELINKHMCDEHLTTLQDMKIVTEQEITKYKTTYKYLPAFFDVRI